MTNPVAHGDSVSSNEVTLQGETTRSCGQAGASAKKVCDGESTELNSVTREPKKRPLLSSFSTPWGKKKNKKGQSPGNQHTGVAEDKAVDSSSSWFGFFGGKKTTTTTCVEPPSADMNAVFAEIQLKGTSGLKHVDKNATKSPKDVVPPKKPGESRPHERPVAPLKPPSTRLVDEIQWHIENYNTPQTIKLEEATMKQGVQIRNCSEVAIQVTTKVNNVIIEGCKKISLILTSLISSVEILNSQKIEIQVMQYCPCFTLDSCSGMKIFLSREGKDCTIATSRISEVNVSFPKGETAEDVEDWVECPIPEQFIHRFENDVLKTEVSDLYR